MLAIRTHALRKQFGDFVAVCDVTFDVPEGSSFGLLGPNGAGKSTLIRMLTTLMEPTAGAAIVAGHNVRDEPDAVRRAIGVIPQALTSDPDLTAAENLEFHARLYGVRQSPRRQMVNDLLAAVELTAWRNRLVGTFSGGMRRRLEIARSLMHQPRILFLDEPTTGLDPVSRRAMWEMIQRLKSRVGVTLFLTTHYIEEADQVCDRVAIVDHGRIVAEGDPARLKAEVVATETIEVEFVEAPAGWADAVRRLPGVTTLDMTTNACTIHSSDRSATVGALVTAARWSGVTITSLVMRGGTLEDAFVQLTGRHLRDAADGKRSLDVRHLYERQRRN